MYVEFVLEIKNFTEKLVHFLNFKIDPGKLCRVLA
jgi:hypothetical protein